MKEALLLRNAPRVLVSGSVTTELISVQRRAFREHVVANVISGLNRCGIRGQFVDASAADADPGETLAGFQGLVVLGGSDIDPSNYGQEPGNRLYAVDASADALEIGLIRAAANAGMPTFGICRGMQLMNVAMGGTLVQHIGDHTFHSIADEVHFMADHPVHIVPNGLLASILGSGEVAIRSGHHQAVERIANPFRVSALASDGVIEAIETRGEPWALGVQWHPETSCANVIHFDALLSHFAQACNAWQQAQTNPANCLP